MSATTDILLDLAWIIGLVLIALPLGSLALGILGLWTYFAAKNARDLLVPSRRRLLSQGDVAFNLIYVLWWMVVAGALLLTVVVAIR